MKLAFIVSIVFVTIGRLILNIIIYRSEYDYHEYTDGVAIDFSKEEVEKRDNAVALWASSLFTFYWTKVKIENKKLSILSNILSVIFFILVISLLIL